MLFGLIDIFQRKYIYPLKYKQEIVEIANNYGIDEYLIFAFVKVESAFNKNAVSNKGAMGLMQITDRTARYIADRKKLEKYDLFNERENIDFGCFYIKYLTEKFKNLDTVIVAYNAGEGNVISWLNNREYSLDGVSLNVIPFSESREYLKKISKSYERYKELYGKIVDKN